MNDDNWPVPQGACDTHFHIYDLAVPMVAGGNRPSPPRELVDYLKVSALLQLAAGGRCRVELSAPYHGSRSGAPKHAGDPPQYNDMIPFAHGLLNAAPDHMVWATDRPHPMVKSNFPDEMDLLNVLCI